jgi:hypothetical protein
MGATPKLVIDIARVHAKPKKAKGKLKFVLTTIKFEVFVNGQSRPEQHKHKHLFDVSKSSNPFAYFTQIIYYAFLRRIQKEKKQAYIKLKKIEMSDVDSQMKKWFRENYLGGAENKPSVLTETDIQNFEKKTEPEDAPKTKSKTKKKVKGKK